MPQIDECVVDVEEIDQRHQFSWQETRCSAGCAEGAHQMKQAQISPRGS